MALLLSTRGLCCYWNGGDSLSSSMAHTNTVPTPGTGTPGLQPSNLLGTVIKGLYDSANTATQNFGFTIPQAALVLGTVAIILLVWSMVSAMRNRKHFSLEDDDVELSKSNDHVRGRVLRPESGTEGSKGALI